MEKNCVKSEVVRGRLEALFIKGPSKYVKKKRDQREALRDSAKLFDLHPIKLVRYIENAVLCSHYFVGVHLFQLCQKLRLRPIMRAGESLIPNAVYIMPKNVENIEEILRIARTRFPEPQRKSAKV